MKTAHIIYRNYLNDDGTGMSLGGIQTYITNLCVVLRQLDYRIVVYQRGKVDFRKMLDNGVEVCGYACPKDKVRKLNRMLCNIACDNIDVGSDILVFGCESMAVKVRVPVKTFAIQHGVSWDIPEEGISSIGYTVSYLKKQYYAWLIARRIRGVDHLVCVDCNFVNWYRALVPCPQVRLHYVPNFSSVPQTVIKPDTSDGVRIIFARRFFPHRGTRLFKDVAIRLLKEYDNLRITIAGEGPDEELLQDAFAGNSYVNFIKYDSSDSLKIHESQHIAVIPTIGSEGTSLSLLEAMAAGCTVVCTNVGGMTNIVIDGYNGLMVDPDPDSVFDAICSLIGNDDLRVSLAERGRETVISGFSIERWQAAWKRLFNNA